MKKLKISTLWCGDISQSVIFSLIKFIAQKDIEFVHPSEAEIIFFGPYDLLSFKRRSYNYFKKRYKIIGKVFPNLDLYLLNRKIKPIRIFFSHENTFSPDIYYDFSITSQFNIHDETHLRFPIWKDLIDWSHLGFVRAPTKFVNRFDNFYNINQLTKPLGNEYIKKKRNICIFSTHLKEPRKSMRYFFSKNFRVDGYGPYFDTNIENHNSSIFSKKSILQQYAFNLCPENSLYPGYYTEKVPEAFLGKSLPLTWADPNIKLDFNENSFINLFHYFHDDYYKISNLLKDEIFLKKFTYEPLLLSKPNLDLEYKFIEKVLKSVN